MTGGATASYGALPQQHLEDLASSCSGFRWTLGASLPPAKRLESLALLHSLSGFLVSTCCCFAESLCPVSWWECAGSDAFCQVICFPFTQMGWLTFTWRDALRASSALVMRAVNQSLYRAHPC
eukprot:3188766-Amphidinium_carterae.1